MLERWKRWWKGERALRGLGKGAAENAQSWAFSKRRIRERLVGVSCWFGT